VDSIVVKIFKYVSYISGVCLIAIMFVAFFNVLGEKILHKGIPASTEIIQYLHIPVVFLACAYVTVDRGHTKIDLLSSHFPMWLQQLCTTLGNLIGAFICGFVGYRGIVQMNKFISTHAKSSTTGVGFVKWPFALIFAIGFFLLAFSFLWSIVRQYVGKTPESTNEEEKQ
jgi:TRAP-type C4-dicarboxylate transport system permease small subunit